MIKHIEIIDGLIKEISDLNYDTDFHKCKHSVDDTINYLPEIKEIIGSYGVIHWGEKLKSLDFGFDIPSSNAMMEWEAGQTQFIKILNELKSQVSQIHEDNKEIKKEQQFYKIFLSHCSKDKKYADALREFIIGLGIKNEQLIYTSHELHKTPNEVNIFDYLRNSINSKVYMIFLLSNNYFDSPACLNEMGAAWITQTKYISFFTPNFNFDDTKYNCCVIDQKKKGVCMDKNCKISMVEFKSSLKSISNINCDEKSFIHLLDQFINQISD